VIAYATSKIRDHVAQIRRCVGLLNDDQLWYRPNESSNSVANLLLHLRGNIAQWIIGGLGGKPCERDRPAEFAARGSISRTQLLGPLEETAGAAYEVLQALPADGLCREYLIQDYRVSGLAAVIHVVEHLAFHTGQVVTMTKWLVDVDLSLYDEQGRRRDGRRQDVP
jgi:uncharacterized damage-inducible protein DinB